MHLLGLGENIPKEAEDLYNKLVSSGVEVLFDDRPGLMPGEKFADADLIGIPTRVVVSVRSLENGGVEVKNRSEEKGEVISIDSLLGKLGA